MSGHHLTLSDRGKIEAYLDQGMSQAQIARNLGRSQSVISRELRRNTTRNGYKAERAHRKYQERRSYCRPERKLEYKPLREFVIDMIMDHPWSPKNVAVQLPILFPDDPRMRISHETIYQAIYNEHHMHFLSTSLPQRQPRRRKKHQSKRKRGPAIPNRVDISERPDYVDERSEPGHWEGDTVVGKNQDGFIVTIVERYSRLLHAVKVETKQAAEVGTAIIESLLDRPASWLKTITFDNGSEFADHERIVKELNVSTYFAQPYCAWQRGTNENTNGIIRRFLPKGTSFTDLTQDQLDRIVDLINSKPKECLGNRTPNQVFQQMRREHLLALGT